MKHAHPYVKYEETPLWDILKSAIHDLAKNRDIEITTREEYIIGYLCDKIKGNNPQILKDTKGNS